ncbi:MAG: hypothetical protein U0234_09455 [Sandaracinus sp.]
MTTTPRSSWSRLVVLSVLAAAWALAGCGGGAFRAPLRNPGDAISDSDRRDRIALGAVDVDLAGEPATEVARLRRIAALELHVGNVGLAEEATLRALRIARAYAALAEPDERGRAESLHHEMHDEALSTADRIGSLELALEAVGRGDPGGGRDVIARLVRARADAGESLDDVTLPERLARALDDAARLDFERLGAHVPGEPLSIDRLTQLGPRAIPRLHQRLDEAARSGDVEALVRLARALRQLDRWDPLARAIVHLDEAHHGELAIDVVGTAPPATHGVAIARLERARRQIPESAAVALALAARCLEASLAGDALDHAQGALSLSPNEEERQTAALIAGLASIVDGEGQALDTWERGHDDGRRSVAVARALAAQRAMPGANEWLRGRMAMAARLLVELGVADATTTFEVASDPATPSDLRGRALDALWVADRPAARIAAECASERVARDACEARLDLLGESAWREGGAPSGPVPDLDETALPGIELAVGDSSLAAVSTWVDSASSRRLSLAPAWIRARVVLAGRLGDVGEARAILASDGALLTAASRVVLEAWLDDVAHSRDPSLDDLAVALGLGPALVRFATPPLDEASLDVATPTSETARLVAADTHLAYDAWQADAPTHLAPLLARADDQDGAVIAGWIGAAIDRDVHERGASTTALAPIAERAHALAPDTAIDRLLQALRAGDEDGPAEARAALARVLVLAPEEHALQRRWLAAWNDADPFASADEARALLEAIDPLGVPPAALAGDASNVGDLLALYGIDLPGRHADVVMRVGPRMARAEGAWDAILVLIRERVRQGVHADGGTDALRALVEAAPPSASRRRWRTALRIVISDLAGAADAANEPEPEGVVAGTDPPLPAGDRLRAIVHGRRELDDALLWALIAEEALGDDPATLERLRVRALHRPRLDPLLCGELARRQGFSASTMEVCLRAWAREPEPISASVLARAFLEARPPSGLSPTAFFEQAHQALADQLPSSVLHEEAIWRARAGDAPGALTAEIEAEARGHVPGPWGGSGPPMRRGVLVRAQRARPVPRWADLALLALGDARVAAAQLYAAAAIASVRERQAPDASTDLAYAARDLVAWAMSDRAADRIDDDGIEAFERARVRGLAAAEVEPLAQRFPESSLVAYASAVSAIRAGHRDEALRWADVGLRSEPRPTLVTAIAPIVEDVRGPADASALRARAHDAYPDDPRFDRAATDPVPPVAPTASARPTTSDESCELSAELAAAPDDEARDAILRDAYRAAHDASARRRVLACTDAIAESRPPRAPEVAAVATTEPARPAASSAAERRRQAEAEAEARAAAAEAESRRRAEEATRRAQESEERAAAAEAREREAQARVAEAERRAAEAERRAIEARARARAATEPTAETTSDAEARAAEAERRVVEAERRAAEADARAALAERTAIEEMRRIAEASRRASETTASATVPETTVAVTEPTPAVAAVPESTETTPVAAAVPEPTPPTTTEPTPTPAVATAERAAEAPTEATPTTAPVTSSAAPTPPSEVATAEPTAPPVAPAQGNVLYSPELPPPTPAERAARARALAEEAEQRVAVSEERVATAAARAADAEAIASEAGPRASGAETRVVDGEQRALEAETRAAEAERRAAEASRRLAEVVTVAAAPMPTEVTAATPETSETTVAPTVATSEVVTAAAETTLAPTSVAVAEPESTHLGGLGLEAVLDPDPAAQRRGVELAARDPAGALVAARDLVLAPAPAVPPSDGLPPFGKVQALVALPLSARTQLAHELMNGSDRALRLVALAAEQLRPDTVDAETLRRTIETEDAGLALEAVRAHGLRPRATDLAAMRTRLDAMHAPLAPADRALAAAIVHALAAAGDAHDRARLAAAPALVRSGAEASSDLALASAVDHDAALYLAARGAGLVRDPRLAPEAERLRRARRPSPPSAEAVRLLASDSLARVLSGNAWRFVRLAMPSRFVSALTGEGADPVLALPIRAWVEEHGGAELGPSGGLDGERPIECALADSGPSSWVCVATVRDRDVLRASLARRPLGAHSAPWIALGAADLARTLPMMAGPTPFVLDRLLAAPGASDADALAFSERARVEVDLGGVTVERFATLARRGDAATTIDDELYLFTGDRVVVFGDEETARTLLGRPPIVSRALSRSARFRRVTRGWIDGPTLEIATLDWRPAAQVPLFARRDASIVLAPDAGGVVATMEAPLSERWRDVAPLSALLPDEAVSRYALAVGAPAVPRTRRAPAAPPPSDRAALAALVLRESERIALAWMPSESGALWDRWIAVVEGPRIDGALAAAGVSAPEGDALATLAGGSIARRGTRWIVGATEEDVRAALARPDVPAAARTTALGAGHLHAARAAQVTAAYALALPPGDARYAELDGLGDALATAGELSFEATVEARTLVLLTRVRPRAP